MKLDLDGRTALVTGSTQGIGAAIAAGLAKAGARVVVNGRGDAGVAQAIRELESQVPDGEFVAGAGDVTTDEGARQVLDRAGRVDVLVNNLGIFGAQEPLEITDDEWRRYFEVNVLAAVRLTRLTLPAMTEQGWGRCSTSRATRPS